MLASWNNVGGGEGEEGYKTNFHQALNVSFNFKCTFSVA